MSPCKQLGTLALVKHLSKDGRDETHEFVVKYRVSTQEKFKYVGGKHPIQVVGCSSSEERRLSNCTYLYNAIFRQVAVHESIQDPDRICAAAAAVAWTGLTVHGNVASGFAKREFLASSMYSFRKRL